MIGRALIEPGANDRGTIENDDGSIVGGSLKRIVLSGWSRDEASPNN
jgi:hypothetical protein